MEFQDYTPTPQEQAIKQRSESSKTLDKWLAACPVGKSFIVPPEAEMSWFTVKKRAEKWNKQHGTKFRVRCNANMRSAFVWRES